MTRAICDERRMRGLKAIRASASDPVTYHASVDCEMQPWAVSERSREVEPLSRGTSLLTHAGVLVEEVSGRTSRMNRTFLTLLSAILVPCLAAASGTIEETVAGFVAKAGLNAETPALVVRISAGAQPEYNFAVGLANVKTRSAATADTLFRLASVSKPFTAIATLQLAERGLIDLDKPAQFYASEIPWPQVTVRHLLNHTGGLPDYLKVSFVKSRPDNHDVFHEIRNRKLEFIPGTDVHYSNTGYVALALVIEAVTGQDYATCLRQQVFTPCHMEHASVPRWDWTNLPDHATGYERRLRIYFPSDYDTFNGIVGDCGVFASATELDRWLDALHGGRLLNETSRQKAFQPPLPHPGALPYGFGWVITRFGSDTLIWHNGSWLGFDTFVGHLVGRRANIVILSNAGLQGRGLDLADDLGFPLAERLLATKEKPQSTLP